MLYLLLQGIRNGLNQKRKLERTHRVQNSTKVYFLYLEYDLDLSQSAIISPFGQALTTFHEDGLMSTKVIENTLKMGS